MSLARKAIRKHVADLLRGHTIAGDRVTTNRSDRPWAKEVPALVVFTRREEDRLFNQSPRRLEREARVAVALFVETTDPGGFPIDDQIDDLAQQVEDQLNRNIALPKLQPTLDAAGIGINPTKSGLESVDMEDGADGQKLYGSAVLTYLFTYYTTAHDEDGLESAPFLLAGIEWDYPPPDGELEATDEIPISQV